MIRPRNYFFFMMLLLIASLLGSLTGCSGASTPAAEGQQQTVSTPAIASQTAHVPTPAPVYFPGENWQASTPEAQGMDSEMLAAMLEEVQEKNLRLHSLVVARNGYLVLEAYFDPYTADTPHQIASITKSVMGALVGIAIERGEIESIDLPVVDVFKERQIANLDERKKALTLEQLLMLAPGFECEDMKGTEAQMVGSQDWVQFVLDLPMAAEPGTKWTYCSSAVHLVSAILQEATGLDARTYANLHLFGPIGIAEVPPERWPSDPGGVSMGGSGLQLTPTEIARFATLYLNGGRWGDRQIVPEEWVVASTTPHIEVGKMKAYGDMNRSYGYLWSLYPEQKFYSALGRNGQHIHGFPEEDLVVVFTSATTLVSDENQFALLKDYILPSVQSKTALPENPTAAARLERLVEAAALPRCPVAWLPPAAQALNGRPIRIGENPFGWETMTITFKEGEDTADIQFNNGLRLSVGLDNLYRVQELPGSGKVGFKAAWERDDRFTVHQIILGTWDELEISLTVEGDRVTFFQRNVVDGGDLVRIEGKIEEQ